jgi:hypothetical protein
MITGSAAVDDDDSFNVVEYEMALQPFQIRLEYNNMLPVADSEEMLVLNSTQFYLSSILKGAQPDFSRLLLYQFVRDYVMMESKDHFSKIAVNGMVLFTSPNNSSRQTGVQNEIMKSLSLNSDRYIKSLQSAGMTNIINSTLLSMQGNEIIYQDGTMVEMDESQQIDDDQEENPRDMGVDVRMRMTLLICLVIPGSVVSVALMVFIYRWAKQVNWKSTSGRSEDDKVWQRRDLYAIDFTSSSSQEGEKKSAPSICSDISSDV